MGIFFWQCLFWGGTHVMGVFDFCGVKMFHPLDGCKGGME